MNSIWEARYIVIDVETTGSNPDFHSIIDISCVIVENGVIKDEYSTLVKTRQFIPHFISRMTGITNSTLYNAPELREVISKVEKILSPPNTIFVAHNADFDYSFISKAFEKVGYDFPSPPKLCTLKLARRLVGAINKKNLGALADFFNIPLINRHRAYADAKATAMLFLELLQIAEEDHNIETVDELLAFQNKKLYSYSLKQKINPLLDFEPNSLPDSPGVYYFFDNNGRALYVGKAKSLKRRLQSYITNSTTSKKTIRLLQKSHYFSFVQTNTELSAIILESKEIKRLQPIMNIRNRFFHHFPFIYVSNREDFPLLRISYLLSDDDGDYYGPFPNSFIANAIINEVYEVFKIRRCLSDEDRLNPSSRCFYFKIGDCSAPCIEKNEERIDNLLNSIKKFISTSADYIIERLNRKMLYLSNDYHFEEAGLVRDLILELKKEIYPQKNGLLPLSKRNFIIVYCEKMPNDKNHFEIVFIRNGLLAWDYSFSYLFPLNLVYEQIHANFFNGSGNTQTSDNGFTEEIRLIKNWIFSKQKNLKLILVDGKKEIDIENEIIDFIQQD
ncbi:MAG: exonuclease domain-containing protein [Candidatus Kapaibacteriales bacterium]